MGNWGISENATLKEKIKSEKSKTVNINKVTTFDNRKTIK